MRDEGVIEYAPGYLLTIYELVDTQHQLIQVRNAGDLLEGAQQNGLDDSPEGPLDFGREVLLVLTGDDTVLFDGGVPDELAVYPLLDDLGEEGLVDGVLTGECLDGQ